MQQAEGAQPSEVGSQLGGRRPLVLLTAASQGLGCLRRGAAVVVLQTPGPAVKHQCIAFTPPPLAVDRKGVLEPPTWARTEGSGKGPPEAALNPEAPGLTLVA